ncbi:MAG: NADPH:quinone reductase-like Zn-dependent oxidoreductase [Arenicella sp.]|jgi:NADPH:quinone reductase-like Zn-dependent oxidoreductase
MKALCLISYGKILEKNVSFLDIQLDKLKEDQVLIDVHCAGINPIDYKIVNGVAKLFMKPKKPFSLGFDLSGIVIEIGSRVSHFKVGDEVYTKLPWDQMGSLAERAICPQDMLSIKPRNISFEEAAGLPLVASTVLDSFEQMNIINGSRILIHAGSGGIGTFAIQYAKHLGAHVITTCSASNIELLKTLGADQVIDYKKTNYLEHLSDLDFVYDTLGGKYTKEAIKILNPGGTIISIAGHHDNDTLKSIGINGTLRYLNDLKGKSLMKACKKKNIRYKHVWSFPNKTKLDLVRELIENENIRPVNDKCFEFKDAIKALEYLSTERAKGKVIVNIK